MKHFSVRKQIYDLLFCHFCDSYCIIGSFDGQSDFQSVKVKMIRAKINIATVNFIFMPIIMVLDLIYCTLNILTATL